MWTEAHHRRDRKLRRELTLAAAAGGHAAATTASGGANVGEWQAHGGGAFTGGKIVIVGWTGEHFVAQPRPRTPTAAVASARA